MKQIVYGIRPACCAGTLRSARVLCGVWLAAWLIACGGGCTPGEPPSPAAETLGLIAADTAAAYPTTAVDPGRGVVYVAYTSRRDGQTDAYLQRLEAGADALAAPVRVNDVPGDAAAHAQAPAQVAVAPDGNVYVAWVAQTPVEGRRFPACAVRLARSVDGGRTFEPAVTVNENAGFPTTHHFHNLAVGPDGSVYVSWLDGAARDRARRARERGGARRTASTSREPGHDAVHYDAVHYEDDLPGTQLKVARSADEGRTFEPGVTVAEGTCQCCRTALSVAPEGTLYVVWRHIFGDQIRDMALARSRDGGRSFTEPVRVHADDWQINGCPHAGPSAVVDTRGRVHVAWFTGADGRAGVYHATSRDGGQTFGPAVRLAARVSGAHLSMATSSTGTTSLAWENRSRREVHTLQGSGARLDVSEATRVPGASPSVATGGGHQVLAWHDGAQVRVRITRPGK